MSRLRKVVYEMPQIVIATVGILIFAASLVVFFTAARRSVDDTQTTIDVLGIKISGPTAVVMMIIGAGMIVLPRPWQSINAQPISSSPEAPGASADPSASTAKSADAVSIQITRPEDGQKVTGTKGVLLEGTADTADDRRLWVLDHADNGQYYLISSAALVVTGGRWSFFDPQVGSITHDDDGKTFVLTVVRATDECKVTLESAKPNTDGDIAFPGLPSGCVEKAAVSVVKTSS